MDTIVVAIAGLLATIGMAFLQNRWASNRSREQWEREAERHQIDRRQGARDKEITRVLDYLDEAVAILGQMMATSASSSTETRREKLLQLTDPLVEKGPAAVTSVSALGYAGLSRKLGEIVGELIKLIDMGVSKEIPQDVEDVKDEGIVKIIRLAGDIRKEVLELETPNSG